MFKNYARPYLLVVLALLVSITVSAQEEPTFSQTFTPDQRIHDFGTIYERDGKVQHTFEFTNRGRHIVAISQVNAWCGCTTATFTRTPIRPGEKGKVTITFNPSHRPGKFSKEAVVLLNEGKEYIRIWVKGKVIGSQHPVTEDHPYHLGSGLYVRYNTLPFASLRQGQSYTFQQRIANNTNRPMTITFRRVPNNRILQMPDTLLLQPGERRIVPVSYCAPHTYRYNRYIHVYPIVNGQQLKPIRINWFGTDGKDFIH